MIAGIATEFMDLEVAEDVLLAVTGMLVTNKVRLFKNDIEPGRSVPLASYIVADYTGYADEAITYNAASVGDDGVVEVVGVAGEFRPTDSVTPNTIYGCLLLDAADALLCAFRFPAPIPMNSALHAIVVAPRVRIVGGAAIDVVS